MCDNIIPSFATCDGRDDPTNRFRRWKLLHTSYIFFLNQANKGSVLYSVDKCFETGAHPRNFCEKQNFKYLDAIIVGILPRDLVRDFCV